MRQKDEQEWAQRAADKGSQEAKLKEWRRQQEELRKQREAEAKKRMKEREERLKAQEKKRMEEE